MTSDLYQYRILILDFGSQYTQLIARRVRELGVYCQLLPADVDEQMIVNFAPSGVILSGGPESVTQSGSPRAPEIVFQLGCPVLGVCYGMQTMAVQLGGQVSAGGTGEFGRAVIQLHQPDVPLFQSVAADEFSTPDQYDVWMSHGDAVTHLPDGFTVLCSTGTTPIAGMCDQQRKFYGVQFHPEVTHTPAGITMLANFVFEICQCEASWTSAAIIEKSIADIKATVGDGHVLVALSGGVDSAVVAALIHRALGRQLTCIMVDTGLLRHNEAQSVQQVFKEQGLMHVIVVDAKTEFLNALQGVTDPEQKRKIIGTLFIRVFEREAKKLENVRWLGQGTIYPDVIESAKNHAAKGHVIKSHHNVGGLPEDMDFQLIEPLRELFKDEVRVIGKALGLPEALIHRHPFPGPGLALRIIGAITPEKVSLLQRVDKIFIDALIDCGWYGKTHQAFAVLLPVNSVAVKGDGRHYGPVVALRAVSTADFMTASWTELPYAFLAEVSLKIVNQVPEISRVVYDITGKPPATIEWE